MRTRVTGAPCGVSHRAWWLRVEDAPRAKGITSCRQRIINTRRSRATYAARAQRQVKWHRDKCLKRHASCTGVTHIASREELRTARRAPSHTAAGTAMLPRACGGICGTPRAKACCALQKHKTACAQYRGRGWHMHLCARREISQEHRQIINTTANSRKRICAYVAIAWCVRASK